ncbi:MAG: precorrin-6A reductase [Clostridiales bacterium]|nr:precorrin-6A reductase [Clostridiales bacterium]
MKKVLIFAGTTEGHTLAELLNRYEVPIHVCVATEYGEKVLDDSLADKVTVGRLDAVQMEQMIREQEADVVVDATHPYAVIVSRNIVLACQAAGVSYYRLLRQSEEELANTLKDCIQVNSVDEAVEYLMDHPGRALLTTGSKELEKYTKVPDYKERFAARVLSTPEVVAACQQLGFEGKNLIAMQGPFSEAMNIAMLQQTGARYLVTKESGKEGGFSDKVQAAKKAGAQLILIRRPSHETGYTMMELVEKLCPEAMSEWKEIDLISTEPRRITLLGIGMGSSGQLTWEAIQACQKADVVIGAKRMLETLRTFGKPEFESYKSDEILNFIHRNPQYHRVVIALSGDVGFYSGAKKLLEGMDDDRVEVFCGISSVSYFCSRLHMAWDNVSIVSLHGRNGNLVAAVQANEKVFALVGGVDDVKTICRRLMEYGLGDVKIWVGTNLSYPEEQICHGTPEELLSLNTEGLHVILVENPRASAYVATPGISDDDFIRGQVPMTKEEIRTISISKMKLTRNSIVYDVGAGTGSVAVEAARQTVDGHVFAIEKNPEGIALIELNARKFGITNLTPVEGLAPEAMKDLPIPTHAFIGGSSGSLIPIMEALRLKNPGIRMIVNAISLETIGELMDYWKKNPPVHQDVVEISAAKGKEVGSYHMMMGRNPVLIAAFDYQ